MRILNPNSGTRAEVKDLKELLHEDKKYMEFTVIGNNGEWKEAVLYDDFMAVNPALIEEE